MWGTQPGFGISDLIHLGFGNLGRGSKIWDFRVYEVLDLEPQFEKAQGSVWEGPRPATGSESKGVVPSEQDLSMEASSNRSLNQLRPSILGLLESSIQRMNTAGSKNQTSLSP